MKHIYRHLGDYNEVGDIRELTGKSADEIIDYWKRGYGNFFTTTNPESDTDIVLEDEIGVKGTDVTTDRRYMTLDYSASWDEWREKFKDAEDGDGSDTYVDIYELYAIEEDGVTYVKRG